MEYESTFVYDQLLKFLETHDLDEEQILLYSPAIGACRLTYIESVNDILYPIVVTTDHNGYEYGFTKDGKIVSDPEARCMLFPSKFETDWNALDTISTIPLKNKKHILMDTKNPDNKESRRTIVLRMFECDKPTVNGTVYPREVMEKAVKEANERIKSGQSMFGYIGRDYYEGGVSIPQDTSKAAITVEGFAIDSNSYLISEVKPLPNQVGKLAQTLIDSGIEPTLTAVGYTTDDKTVTALEIMSVDFEPKLKSFE